MLETTRGSREAITGSDLMPTGLLSVAGPGFLLVLSWRFADAPRSFPRLYGSRCRRNSLVGRSHMSPTVCGVFVEQAVYCSFPCM